MSNVSTAVVVGLLFVSFASLPRLVDISTKWKRARKHSKLCVGVDIGGSTVKLSLVDARSGKALASAVRSLASGKTPEETVRVVTEILQELLEKLSETFESGNLVCVGVSVPGRVDEARGVVLTSAHFGPSWREAPLSNMMERSLSAKFNLNQFKFKLINDASAALYGEIWSGAAAGCDDCVLVTLGTGVGAAVCSDGRVLQGSTGMFGEIGHSFIDYKKDSARFSTATGVAGIFEEYCSSRGLILAYEAGAPTATATATAPAVDAKMILTAAKSGKDSKATRVVDEYFDLVGALMVNAARCYDPSVIVVAGGVVEAGEWYMTRLREAALARQWTLAPQTFEIRAAVHGQYAGCVGAAFVAVRDVKM